MFNIWLVWIRGGVTPRVVLVYRIMRRLVITVTHHIILIIVADVDVIMPRVGMLLNL